jgi:hypothetical protein
MPVKGLTHRDLTFPRIGTIRKGAVKEEKAPGKDLTYFRVEFDDDKPEAAARFRAVYGPEPRRINIRLPFADVDRSWQAWREAYLAGGLVHRCDGESIQYEIDLKTGTKTVVNGRIVDTDLTKKCDGKTPVAQWKSRNTGEQMQLTCNPVGRLNVIVPEVEEMAYLTFITSSINDIVQIDAQLRGFHGATGSLVGLPLILARKPVMVSTPGKGVRRVRREKWLCVIEADPNWVRAKLRSMQIEATPLALLGKSMMSEYEDLYDAPEMDVPPGAVVEQIGWPAHLIAVMVEAELAEHAPDAIAILDRTPWADPNGGLRDGEVPSIEDVLQWARLYTEAKLNQSKTDFDKAAAIATSKFRGGSK